MSSEPGWLWHCWQGALLGIEWSVLAWLLISALCGLWAVWKSHTWSERWLEALVRGLACAIFWPLLLWLAWRARNTL